MILWDDASRKEELSAMWQRIFHDTKPYTAFYFDEIYGKNEVILEMNDEKIEDTSLIRGMLHLNPYELQMRGNSDQSKKLMTAHYIVGVSTEEQYRRQGVMRRLLNETFRTLRERGEAFTYLMPADENYYLPFSFRFGMEQYVQECQPGNFEPEDKDYGFTRLSQSELSLYANTENSWKRENYAISTKISREYLERLDKEVRSEFGCLFFVSKEGRPIGRFVVYAEDDFLTISQLACYDSSVRAEFLKQMIQFCHERYHFRAYRITYPEDWKNDMLSENEFPELRIFAKKKTPVIMFRILKVEELASWLGAEEDFSCLLKIQDPQIQEQEGFYEFSSHQERVEIRRLSEQMDGQHPSADGAITISDLTARLFGNHDGKENVPASFNEKAAHFWNSLRGFTPIEISEIV